MSRLQAVAAHGQSIWLDFIDRELLDSGALAQLIETDGIAGLTSNPAIFEKAIAATPQYDAALQLLLAQRDDEPAALVERLAIPDIQRAADLLQPVYARTAAADGYVSFEVAPHLCADTAATVREARRLWAAIARPNLMIKVPGTPAGIAALRELLIDGINVNVTLLFSRAAYRATAAAYIDALGERAARGERIDQLASIASFFISRIDSEIDARIESRIAIANDADRTALAALRGRIAIANAQLAYRDFTELFTDNPRWQALVREHGARPQRLLWASTGTKNAQYRDVLYVESLIGAPTVNTVPPATLDAFRDHGLAATTLGRFDEAAQQLAEAERLALDLDGACDKLLREGLALFQDADDRLNAALARKRSVLLGTALPTLSVQLPEVLAATLRERNEQWRREHAVRRLWRHDASLWTNADEAQWLDWLHAIDVSRTQLGELQTFARDLDAADVREVVLLGMGGSSLGPEVLAQILGASARRPLQVLDSTDPAQIRAREAQLDLRRTLFIVSSKSGSTMEVDLLCRYFHARVVDVVGAERAGAQFVAVTDPGSKLEALAQRLKFRKVFAGTPGIGGRYSVLSAFGLVPAAAMGLDLQALLDAATSLQHSCAASVPPAEHPGVQLGLVLGLAARAGRDKLTLLCAAPLLPFGTWVDQLIAESTGKLGLGIVPIDDEPPGALETYGADRVFVQLRLDAAPDAAQDTLAAQLATAGHPLLTIRLHALNQIAGEFFRWSLATAVAGSVLGVNPFDQPDVEAAKQQTRALLSGETASRTADDALWCVEHGVSVHVDAANAARLQACGNEPTLAGAMAALLAQLQPRDYFALLAFIEMRPAYRAVLQQIRSAVHARARVASCLDFGPRYLHSTGQLYKGGPNSGVFVLITADDAKDLAVPERSETFGMIKAAQAAGDLAVLEARGRRIVHVHLGANIDTGLQQLHAAFETALATHRGFA